jgi:amino acid adenylation domain-containing protein
MNAPVQESAVLERLQGFRLSPRQRHQWLAGFYGSEFAARCVVGLAGNLEIGALRCAVQQMIGRHEILRTRFRSRPGLKVALQIVEEDGEYEWHDLGSNGGRGTTDELLAADAALAAGREELPGLRCLLVEESPGRHQLLLRLPGLCADARSLANLVAEIAGAYGEAREGAGAPAQEQEIVQYLQVSEWQNDLLEAGDAELASGKDFWCARGELPEIALPFERGAGGEEGGAAGTIDREVEAELWSLLRRAAGALETSPEVFLLCCWSALLARLTGERQIGLLYVGDGRSYDDLQSVLGPLAVTLPLQLKLPEERSFRSVLKGNEATVKEAVRWQDYLYTEDWWRGVEAGSAIGFEFQPQVPPRGEAGVVFTLLRRDVRSEPTKLKLCCAERADGLSLRLQPAPGLFGEEELRRLLDQLVALAASAARDPELPVAALDLFSAEERRQLLVDFNRTAVSWPQGLSIRGLFAEHAEHAPDRVAVVDEDRWLSCGELAARADRLGRHLRRLGAGPDSVVAIALERSAEVVVGILGTWQAGAAYLPLDVSQPGERLAALLAESGAVAVLLREGRLDSLPHGGAQAVCVDRQDEAFGQAAADDRPARALPENLAYVIFTSGSTGRPKGVAVPHRSLLNYVAGILERLALPPGASFATVSSFAADLGNTSVFASLCSGGCLHIVSEERVTDAAGMAEYMERHAIDCLKIVPSHLEALGGSEILRALPRRRLVLGGEASRRDWVERMASGGGCRILNHYGPTETTVGVLTCEATEALGAPLPPSVPLGRPLANSRVYVLDRWLSPVPLWVTGDLYVAGAGLARGYLGQAELTAERFIPDPWSAEPGGRMYRTGDLARHRPERVVEFLGRGDDQVKLRGYRIEPGEIEASLRRHPGVSQVAVVAREDEPGDKRLVAYVVPVEEPGPAAPELRSFVSKILPGYMVPADFVALRALPLTRNGKLDRRALPPPPKASGGEARESAIPDNPIEELLAEIWAEVLKVARVGSEDNFFDLGGHSLLATRVIARIREAFGVTLPVREIFDQPTVSRLAASIFAALKAGEGSPAPPLQARPHEGPLPLSFAQQRLWFLDQLAPGSSVYNIPRSVLLTGTLHLPVLARAAAEIVRRHEVLRTTFAVLAGEPVARIGPPEPPALPVVDLRDLGPGAPEEARRLAQAEAGRPFDLERGPLLRLLVVRLGEASSALVSTMHHIASDGWSAGILIRELSALYGAFLAGRPSPLPELPIQYADFAVWQRQWLQGEVLDAELRYWREQLAGVPRALELPTDRPRPARQTFTGASLPFRLPQELAERLEALGRRCGATRFMTLLAAFQELLGRCSGQLDLAVGTPVAGRTHRELEELIGFFVNMLVIRTQLAGESSFAALLGRVRETVLSAYAHQDLPFESLVEQLRVERSLSRTPLFQVVFALQNVPRATLDAEGLAVAPLAVKTDTAKFDLTLVLQEVPGGLAGSVEFNTDLFDGATIRRMVRHWEVLLAGVATAPERRLSELDWVTPEERSQILWDWNDTARPCEQRPMVHELFARHAALHPQATAVASPDGRLSYGEVERQANRLAWHLRTLGVGPDVLVAICTERTLLRVVGIVAVLKAGGAYVSLDPRYPPERLAFLVEDARAPVLLTEERFAGQLPECDAEILRLDADWAEVQGDEAPPPPSGVGPENLSYVVYTSGSTGKPKGVEIPHAGLMNLVRWHQNLYGVTAEDRGTQIASPAFDASIWELWPYLAAGASVHIPDEETRLSSAGMVRWWSQERITLAYLMTPLAEGVLEEKIPPALELEVRALIIGGDRLHRGPDPEVGFRLMNHYGPAEYTVTSTVVPVPPKGEERGLPTIGRPIDNTVIYVLDSSQQLAPVGVPGELYVAGVGLARGYLRRPDLTAAKFVPDPWSPEPGARMYRTADQVRWLPDGDLDFLGRLDRQVKIRGLRIELGEIESSLGQHPGLKEVAVLVREDRPGARRLTAYVVAGDPAAPPSGEELRGFLAERLPRYMVPETFVPLEALPLTPNGKVDRQALPAPRRSEEDLAELVAPRDALERELVDLWQEVLGTQPIGIRDRFFELGGHSLLAVRLRARLEERFEREIPLAILVQDGTVEGLAELLRGEALAPEDESPLVTLHAAGEGPPLFLAHPAGGGLQLYGRLVHHLGSAHPVHGFQAKGLATEEAPRDRIEEMAEHYVRSLRQFAPSGPYRIAGSSMGALLAFEMACQLRNGGQEVALLALIDPPEPNLSPAEDPSRPADLPILLLYAEAYRLAVRREELEPLGDEERLALVVDRAVAAGIVPPSVGRVEAIDFVRRMVRVFQAGSVAGQRYVPGPYAGPVTLLRVAQDLRGEPKAQTAGGWSRLCAEPITVLSIPGNHNTMLEEPNVRRIAELLHGLLAARS